MKTKTKRRKVWVNFYGGQPFAHPSSKDAKRTYAVVADKSQSEAAVRFVEARPGDVVLSHEDAVRLIALVDETARDEGRDSDREALIVLLLRGGR